MPLSFQDLGMPQVVNLEELLLSLLLQQLSIREIGGRLKVRAGAK
jgi:hypothetical protein